MFFKDNHNSKKPRRYSVLPLTIKVQAGVVIRQA